jgi:endonuclease/exonuclease/phosphatase family metal-dependent hydrolase
MADGEDIVRFPPGPALAVSELDEGGNPVPVDQMGRGALRVRVTKEGFTADLITVHLKSKLLSFPRPGGRTSFAPRDEGERAQVAGIALRRRAAAAVTLRLRANELLEDDGRVPLLLLGDLNDVPDGPHLTVCAPEHARSDGP